jgi:MoxR-like ATPase
VIRGKEAELDLLLAGLLAGGHLLLEDLPGTGKTTLAKALARCLGMAFRRIQFTPDLLPSDILGGSIFRPTTGEMEFRPGPIFTDLLLADEINRAAPRTQAALLEAMAEHQVSLEGNTLSLGGQFTVIATLNPLESVGVHPLPEAELDRFLCSLTLGHPDPEAEAQLMLERRLTDPLDQVQPLLDLAELSRLRQQVREVSVAPALAAYIAQLLLATRQHPAISLGASTRAGLGLLRFAQALALLSGRDHVRPEEIQAAALPVLRHRLVTRQPGDAAGRTLLIQSILAQTPLPL